MTTRTGTVPMSTHVRLMKVVERNERPPMRQDHYEVCPLCAWPTWRSYVMMKKNGFEPYEFVYGSPCHKCIDVRNRSPEIFAWVLAVLELNSEHPPGTTGPRETETRNVMSETRHRLRSRIIRDGSAFASASDFLPRSDPGDMMRAEGDCLCKHCGREYRHHGVDPYEGIPTLHVLCDGQRVKL